MRLTRVFLRRPTLAFVFCALTLLAGFFALRSLVVQEMPNTALPTININVAYSGASTSELRDEVARPIEDQLAGTPYLDHTDTTIQSGSVNITASFSLQSSDTENIANVEKALQAAERQLPSTITPPTIRVADPSEPNVVSLALQSKRYSETDLGALANNLVIPAIEQFPGVANASVYGTTQAAIEVLADPNRLASANLTLTDVVNSISPDNIRAPGGIVYQRGHETQIDVRGDITDPTSVARLPIHVAYAGPSSASPMGGASSASGGASANAGGGAASSAGYAGAAGAASGGTSAAAASQAADSASTSGYGGAGSGEQAVPRANVTAPPLNVSAPSGAASSPNPSSPVAAPPASGHFGTSGTGNSSPSGTGGTSSGTGGASSGTGAMSTSTSRTATSGSSQSSGNGSTGGAGQGSSPNGGGASGSSGGAFGSSSAGGSATTVSTNATTGQGSSSASGTTSAPNNAGSINLNPVPNVPIDQSLPVGAPSTTSGTATSSAPYTQGVLPSVSSSEIGAGAGTSMSPFSGNLSPWATPSSDKRIDDVAQVLSGSVVQRVYESINGRTGVTVNAQKATTASEVTVASGILRNLGQLRSQFNGVTFSVLHVQSTYTEEQLEGVEHTLIEGIILTAIVMLLFLQSWRNAVVVMVAIPVSLGVTLFVMNALHLTLDTISLLAMTLIIGILIDDSTVVLENIERHHRSGEAPADAALRGRSEIGLAAIVITLVDVVVFLPIAFIGGPVGVQLAEFGIVVSIATLTSLLVSFTITPTMAGLWSLKSTWKPPRFIRWFDERFTALRARYAERWLPAAMARPWPIVIVAAILCIAALALVPLGLIGEEYIPAGDQGIVFVQITYPPGHPLDETHDTMNRIENRVRQIIPASELQAEVTISGGYGAPFGGFVQEGNIGQMNVYLEAKHKTPTTDYVTRLQRELPRLAQGAQVTVAQATQQGGGHQQPIDELVTTTNGTDPTPFAAKVYRALQQTPGTTGASNSAANVAPQVEVAFDRVALQALDVSIGTAATAVQAAFGGDQATQFETADKGLVYVEVIYPRSAQGSLDDVRSIPLRSQNGGIVRLGDVAHLRWAPTPLVLTRENRQDVVHVSANVSPGASLSAATKAFLQRVASLHLPKAVVVHPAAQGQQDLMNQALRTLASSLMGSIVLVFFMIVALYNSYRTPFVTLFAIPVATIGAFGLLWVTHQTLNLYSLIGMVLLVGLVTKNGILLVDYADTMRTRGKSREDAMKEAAATRFRPILMTTVAMVAGMLPLALGLNPGGGTRASLGIAVIGGLISSLVLTLAIVPIMYTWLAPKELPEELHFSDEPQPGSPQPAAT